MRFFYFSPFCLHVFLSFGEQHNLFSLMFMFYEHLFSYRSAAKYRNHFPLTLAEIKMLLHQDVHNSQRNISEFLCHFGNLRPMCFMSLISIYSERREIYEDEMSKCGFDFQLSTRTFSVVKLFLFPMLRSATGDGR